MTNETQFFRKIYLSHFIRNGTKGLRKGYVWEVSWRLNKAATYWPPASLAIAGLLSYSAGLLHRGPWGPSSLLGWFSLELQQLTPNSDLQLTRIFVAPGYIIVWHPPASVSVASALNLTRPQSRLSPDIFDRMHMLFTRVHFSFDSSAGSEVNMLQVVYTFTHNLACTNGNQPLKEFLGHWNKSCTPWHGECIHVLNNDQSWS